LPNIKRLATPGNEYQCCKACFSFFSLPDIKSTREIERIGAHVRGYNARSIGICYEGGLDCHGRPTDTRTEWQIHSMRVLVLALLRDYLLLAFLFLRKKNNTSNTTSKILSTIALHF